MTQVSTDEAEGAQAVFCAVADYIGLESAKKIFEPYYENRNWKKWRDNKKEKLLEENARGANSLSVIDSYIIDDFLKQKIKVQGSNITIEQIIEKGFSERRIQTYKSKEVIVKYIKENKDWFVSSLKIALELLDRINEVSNGFNVDPVKWQDIYYFHGDKQVDDIMKIIKELFLSANNQSAKVDGKGGAKYFGDINKWSPADIYFASNKAKIALSNLRNNPETKKNNLTFAVLNETIGTLIESGDILPLSLKKVLGNVIIKKVNFDRKLEETLLAKTYCTGVQPWNKMTGKYELKPKFKFTQPYTTGRDIYIKLKSDDKEGRIQIRHVPASNGKPSGPSAVKIILSYVGSSALGGQVIGIPLLSKIVKSADEDFAKLLKECWDKNYPKFVNAANAYINTGGGDENYKSTKKEVKKKFDNDIGAISALTVMNPIRKIIDEYFKSPKVDKNAKQHNVIRAIFAYTASRTELSSRFVIAKD